jgi:GTP-binding protein EngB required for normal cell division
MAAAGESIVPHGSLGNVKVSVLKELLADRNVKIPPGVVEKSELVALLESSMAAEAPTPARAQPPSSKAPTTARTYQPTQAPSSRSTSAISSWMQNIFRGTPAPELTIVLLGQTGSGKTSFLNLLCNFGTVLEYGREALECGRVRDFRDVKLENQIQDKSASKTNAATSYDVKVGDLALNIVDTPGFGDTRGRDVDKEHTKKIVDCIKGLQHIHSIVLVISGREARLTTQLKYVLTEICAILPKDAKNNIVVVFTNTSNPLYLSFDMDTLSSLVEHTVPPTHQIFVENPFVLWERSIKHQGKVPDDALKDGLVRAFRDTSENMQKLFAAFAKMERLNTKEFEKLYQLRISIELTTTDCLAQLATVEKEKKNLQAVMEEVRQAMSQEDMNCHYKTEIKDTKWEYQDADRHGTHCRVPGCHSNCHAPCKMPFQWEWKDLKTCCAFRYTKQTLTLNSAQDRDDLLRHLTDQQSAFHTDEDGGEGTDHETILKAEGDFRFKGHAFQKGAMVQAYGSGRRSRMGWSAGCHLQNVAFPLKVDIADESDQDTCKKCGHELKLHYHEAKVWVEVPYTQEVVNDEMQKLYMDAKDLRGKKEIALQGLKQKLKDCEARQEQLSQNLLHNIRSFENKGLSRNYALLLQNQKDLLQAHVDSTLADDPSGKSVAALKVTLDQVERQLYIVQKTLREKGANNVEWARLMLQVEKDATLAQIETQFKKLSVRLHPDKHGGNPERMQQLNEARQILCKHVQDKEASFSAGVYNFFGRAAGSAAGWFS